MILLGRKPPSMAVTLPADVLRRYRRFTLYNSPYTAHDRGRAVDLYPDAGGAAPSPVAGTVRETRTVSAPSKPYAAAEDHLILLDTGDFVARILHVEPTVAAGEAVAVGDSLGHLVRSGYFAPWVDDHLHLEFRDPDADPYRASGSLPLAVDPALDLRGLEWDGTGTVVEVGETYAVLDAPAHPDPGAYYAGLAGRPRAESGDGDGPTDAPVLDGGCPHYEGGGLLGVNARPETASTPVALAGQPVGRADGRHVTWDDPTVRVDGEPITGLSLFCGRDSAGVKLVCPDRTVSVGETVAVTVDRG